MNHSLYKFNNWKNILIICFSIYNINVYAQDSIEKTFELGDFKLESGQVLPNANIKYVTYGRLDKMKSNAILLPSSFGVDYKSYNFLIGKDKALDTSKYFLILTELFANGHSSSPSNTDSPFNGPNFPVITIQDNVNAQYELIQKQWGDIKLKSVIGFSMGAQQAFEWAVHYPKNVVSIIPFCGTAKTYAHGFARLESAIATIQADQGWDNGLYMHPPKNGLKAWALHWATWFLSQDWYRKEKYKEMGYETVNAFLDARIQSNENIDANNQIAQAKTWQLHDIAKGSAFNGNIIKALQSIQCKVLYMPSSSDLYFPIAEAKYESRFIKNVRLTVMQSDWGHLAGAGINKADNTFLNQKIAQFLK